AQAHVPGAVFLDIDAIRDEANPLPHMVPAPSGFAAAMGALGIANDDHVVAYDVHGLMSAARAWWLLRLFGHDRVSILDGGLPKWKAEGRPLEAGSAARLATSFRASFRPGLLRSKAQMLANVSRGRRPRSPRRAAGRFEGTTPEPRAGLRGGHIPGSRNLPFDRLVDPKAKTVLPPQEIARAFAAAGVDPAGHVACSCGSGVTACVLAFGLFLLGNGDAAVYDGSWSEWGAAADTPVEAGPAR
ncbi:MAG: sulfurtransferase, partial [Alphaproteobacteria bacterium]